MEGSRGGGERWYQVPHFREAGYKEGQDTVWAFLLPPHSAWRLGPPSWWCLEDGEHVLLFSEWLKQCVPSVSKEHCIAMARDIAWGRDWRGLPPWTCQGWMLRSQEGTELSPATLRWSSKSRRPRSKLQEPRGENHKGDVTRPPPGVLRGASQAAHSLTWALEGPCARSMFVGGRVHRGICAWTGAWFH